MLDFRRDRVRYAVALVLLAAAYYLSARLGLTMSLVEENVTPLWPPTGIALAAFLLVGRSLWPAVAVAALLVNLPISEGLLAAAATAVGNTLAPFVAAVLLERVGFRRQLDRREDALSIVFIAALGSTVISASVGTATLVASETIQSDEWLTAWLVWWTGDAMGILTVAPFLLCLPLFEELPGWSAARWAEATAVLFAASALVIWTALSDLQLLYLVIPVVAWASWRFQLRGAAPVALLVTFIVTRAAVNGDGPFSEDTLFDQMFKLQTFNACIALTGFFLAAMVTERNRTAEALEAATVELEDRVRRRTAELSATNRRLVEEIRTRSQAQQQLSQEEARARREHEIAQTLQMSLLPDRIPNVPAVAVAARYVPATGDIQVGGDWYDVIPLRDGLIGLAIGDVAGHGLQAAATMGQLRMALRAYAVQDPSPASVLAGVHRLVSHLPMPEMVTLTYLVFDPETWTLRFANAGHPPPLVYGDGNARYLEEVLSPPLGVTPDAEFTEASIEMTPGSTLLLYTDGLIERRGESIEVGMERLVAGVVDQDGAAVDDVCDHLLSALVDRDRVSDDVALVAMRPSTLAGKPLSVAFDAEPRMLAEARRTLRLWLRGYDVSVDDETDILLACGEACANVVRHAYGTAPGEMVLEAHVAGRLFEMTVLDHGEWRAPVDRGGGWGLQLIHGLMDTVHVDRTPDGTVIRMSRQLRGGES